MGKNTATYTYDTFSDLRLTVGDVSASITVLGGFAINDGLQGKFYYDTSSVLADDDLNVIKPTAITGSGRWIRTTPRVTKEDIGLQNVDNTSDLDKPVSTAQATAIANAILTANAYTDDKIADVLGADFGGSITPTTPLSPTGKIFYLATEPGTYTNAGGVVVNTNSFAVISYDGVSAWSISQSSIDLSNYITQDDIKDFKPSYVFDSINVDPRIDIRKIVLSGIGANTQYYLNRVYNVFAPSFSDYRALIQITDSNGTEVARFFQQGLSTFKTGLEWVTLSYQNVSSQVSGKALVNWDAFADQGVITVNYPINIKNSKNPEYSGSYNATTTEIDPSIIKISYDNPSFSGVPLYLTALQNNLTRTLIRIETDTTVVGFFNINNPPVARIGKDQVFVPQYQNSGVNLIVEIDWDKMTKPFNTNGLKTFKLNPTLITGSKEFITLISETAENPKYPFIYTTSVSSQVSISDLIITNADVEGLTNEDGFLKTLYLKRLFNRFDPAPTHNDYRALIEISDGTNIVAQYFKTGLPAKKTGVEIVDLSPFGSNGISIRVEIDWTPVGDSILDNLNYEIVPEIIQQAYTALPPKNYYPFVTGTIVAPQVSISDISISATNPSSLKDADGFLKRFKIVQLYNFFDTDPTHLDNRALIQIGDYDGNIVCQYYAPGLPSLKTGIESVPVPSINGSGIDAVVKIDWDALAGNKLTGLSYEIDPSIVSRGLSGLSTFFFKPFENVLPKAYPKAFDACVNFKSLLMEKERDVNIVFFGDSLTARTIQLTQLPSEQQKVAPVWLIAQSWVKWWYDYFVVNKPDFRRYDADGFFTESAGTWTTSYLIFDSVPVPDWARPNRQQPNNSRYSTSPSAFIDHAWNLNDYEYGAFIHDLDYRAANEITISIQEGNGLVEVFNGTTWVEANGYVFSQRLPTPSSTSGSGASINKVRLPMRAVGTGIVNIKYTKDETSNYFFYYGFEMWNGVTIHAHNAGRGGHNFEHLSQSFNDLAKYNPDLIIWELPLINEINTTASGNDIVNHAWDYIWGDRPGAENPKAMKQLYPDSDFMFIIPHIDGENWNGDKPSLGTAGALNDATGYDVMERVKALFVGRDDGYIDMFTESVRIGKMNGWASIEAMFGPSSNTAIPTTFLRDTSHHNDYLSQIWGAIMDAEMRY